MKTDSNLSVFTKVKQLMLKFLTLGFAFATSSTSAPYFCEKSSYLQDGYLFAVGIANDQDEHAARVKAFENGKQELANYLQRDIVDTSIETQRLHSENTNKGYFVCRLLKIDLSKNEPKSASFNSDTIIGNSNLSEQYSVKILTNPSKAAVLIANESVGFSNIQLSKVTSGRHKLLIQKEGYESVESWINISRNSTLTFNLVPKETRVLIRTNAENASLLINGKNATKFNGLNAEIMLKRMATYDIQISAKNYETASLRLSVNSNDTELSRQVDLEGHPGRLTIISDPPGARAFLNGKFVGTTPVTLTVRPQRYDLKLEHSNFSVHRSEINVEAAKQTTPPIIKLDTKKGIEFDETDDGIKELKI